MVNLSAALISLLLMSLVIGAASDPAGVPVTGVAEGGAAQAAGMKEGIIIIQADGQPIPDVEAFRAFMEDKVPYDAATRPGDQREIPFTDDNGQTYWVRLDSAWDHVPVDMRERIQAENATLARELEAEPRLGIGIYDHAIHTAPLEHPFGMYPGREGVPNFLILISMPLAEIRGQPILSEFLGEFHDFPLGWVGLVTGVLLFWVFWINLMVGLTNILPMLPLDGGHIFRDAIGGLVARIRPRMDPQRREHMVGKAAGIVSVLILVSFLLQIFGPRFL